MQLEGSEFDWTDIFYEQLLPQFTDVGPGYDPSTSDFFGPFALRFIEIIKGYFEDLDDDDIDRIIRQGQVSEFISVLRRFENGDATLDDLKAVDVSDLTEMPGWSDYYSGIIGEGTGDTGDTDDTEEQDPNLKELIEKYGEDVVRELQNKYEELKDFVGTIPEDPVGAIKKMADIFIEGTAGIPPECVNVPGGPTTGPWIRDCVTVGVLIDIGFPGLPSGMGGIFKGATIGEIQDGLAEIGKKFEDILDGNPTCGKEGDQECTPEQILKDLGDWVVRSVGDIFKDDETGTITVGSVLGTLGGVFGSVLGSVIYGEFKDKINNEIENVIGVPVIPFAPLDECEEKGQTTVETSAGSGQFECGPCKQEGFTPTGPNGECIDGSVVDSYDCGKEESRQGGIVIDSSECGECLDGFEEDAAGKCIAKDSDIGDNGPTAAECLEENKEHIAGDDVTDSSCGACLEGYEPNDEGVCVTKNTVTQVECPKGTDKQGQMVNDLSECNNTITQVECPEGTDKAGQMVNDLNQCSNNIVVNPEKEWKFDYCKTRGPEGGTLVTLYTDGTQEESFSEVCYQKASTTPDTKKWKSDYCKTRGPEGGTLVTLYTDGSQEESFSKNCYQAADSTSPGGDGCQGGKVMNPNTDQCECPEGTVENAQGVCVSIGTTPTPTPTPTPPDPCAGQGIGKVMSSDGSDECVCPEGTVEDANGNCVTPTTPPPPPEEEEEESSGGGGGGGGSGGRGLFAPLPDYQRQPFVAVQYRAPVRAINVLDGFVKQELKNSLFS